MWYVMLPTYAITGGCITATFVVPFIVNMIEKGTPYCRRLENENQYKLYFRDLRLSGYKSAYTQYGLDNID